MISAARGLKLLRRCFYASVLVYGLCTTRSLAWETKAQALQQAIYLVHDPTIFGVSTLSTRYPSSHPIAELAGHVISGPEYFAPCEADTGTLLYLGLTVSQTWKNVLNSDAKNATVSIASNTNPAIPDPRHTSGHDSKHWEEDRPSWRRGMPSKARVTLFGHFSILNGTEHPEQAKKALHCYLNHHPDASHWAPDSEESPHIPFWATFTVDKVYWVGGFGDEHYIGWFNSYEWNTAWKEYRPKHRDRASNSTATSLPEDDARLFAVQVPLSTSLEAEEEDQREPLYPELAFQ